MIDIVGPGGYAAATLGPGGKALAALAVGPGGNSLAAWARGAPSATRANAVAMRSLGREMEGSFLVLDGPPQRPGCAPGRRVSQHDDRLAPGPQVMSASRRWSLVEQVRLAGSPPGRGGSRVGREDRARRDPAVDRRAHPRRA